MTHKALQEDDFIHEIDDIRLISFFLICLRRLNILFLLLVTTDDIADHGGDVEMAGLDTPTILRGTA